MAPNGSNKPQVDSQSNQPGPQQNGTPGLVAGELSGLTSKLQGILRDDGQAHPKTYHSSPSDVATQAPVSLDDSGDEAPESLETPMTDHNLDALPESALYGHNVQTKASNGHPVASDNVHPDLDTYSADRKLLEDDIAPVAIIGMSCRFPGDATTPERLWEMCANAREAWSEWPADRFNQDAFLHPNPERGGTVSTVDYCPEILSNMFSSTLEVVTSSHRTWMSLTRLSLTSHPQRPR